VKTLLKVLGGGATFLTHTVHTTVHSYNQPQPQNYIDSNMGTPQCNALTTVIILILIITTTTATAKWPKWQWPFYLSISQS